MINKANYQKILTQIQEKSAKLVAVSKTKPISDIQELYEVGQRIFGENYVQELVEKQTALPNDIEWHFIGHLQSKKVKQIAPFVSMIHAVDSWKLLEEIDKRAAQNERTIDCLLQMHIAQESSKFGMDEKEIEAIVLQAKQQNLTNIRICGLMGMATFTDDKEQVKVEFQSLKKTFDSIKQQYFETQDSFCQISMGMSGDFELALQQGSTMLRIGSLLFGQRIYQ